MTKLKGYLAIFILLLSWLALYWLTGSRTPWEEFNISKKSGELSFYLGDIPTDNYDRMGFTKAIVKYVEAEEAWLVGTERGELFLINNNGKEVWKRTLGIGKLVSVALMKSGSFACVGESSPEANLYCINTHNGDIVWKHKGADYVGTDPSARSLPAIVHIAIDSDDNVYANAYRFVMRKDGSRGYCGRMLATDKAGKIIWRFPAEENIDSWINWCDVNDANNRVVLSTSAYEFHDTMKYKDTMYFVNKKTGEPLNNVFLPTIPPFNNTVMRGSPNFSTDGKYLAGCASDGRGFLFNEKGETLWWKYLSKPTEIDHSWINASGRDGFVTPYGVIFTTINTFNRENWQLPTPVEHPSNNSLFVFNTDGTFKYQFMAKGTVEEIDFADKLAACAVGRNVRTHNYKAHGALLLNLESGKEIEFHPTAGPCQTIAISKDQKHLAGVEAPALTPEGKIIGSYRLHIWNR
ncbi:MAG: hypothetical protein Q4D21_01935 [Phascolarctobacterium sp.]|nr:hypothetical protein [Phascolarctobacterium sp.]